MINMSSLIHAKDEQEFEDRFQKLMKYPNGTWKNLPGIQDPEKLQQFEYHETDKQSLVILKHGVNIKSTNDLAKIHKMLFHNVYPWAGQFRTYNISKNGTDFLPSEMFGNGVQDIEAVLARCDKKAKLDPKDYAELLDKLNYLHPFPEGNGRSTKIFLQCLAQNHGQQLNYERKQDTMIQCLNQANIDGIAKQLHVTNLGESPTARNSKQKDQSDDLSLY